MQHVENYYSRMTVVIGYQRCKYANTRTPYITESDIAYPLVIKGNFRHMYSFSKQNADESVRDADVTRSEVWRLTVHASLRLKCRHAAPRHATQRSMTLIRFRCYCNVVAAAVVVRADDNAVQFLRALIGDK